MAQRRRDELYNNSELQSGSTNSPTERASYGGSEYDQRYFTDDELRQAADIRAKMESGEMPEDLGHAYVEGMRGRYGYSGGADGSQYIQTGGTSVNQPYSYANAGAYTSKYQPIIDEYIGKYLNRGPFNYDYKTDPRWIAYENEYTREGNRAMQDTLAQVSARTGGLASSYAGTAAQQSYNNYMQALTDKIPELYELAYGMWADEGDRQLQALNLLQGLDDTGYGRWADQWNREYQLGRDAIGDTRYDDETAYARQQDAADRILAFMAYGYDPSDEDLAAAGITRAQANALYNYYSGQGSGGGYGYGGGYGGSGGETGGNEDEDSMDPSDYYDRAIARLEEEGVPEKDGTDGYSMIYSYDLYVASPGLAKKFGSYEAYVDHEVDRLRQKYMSLFDKNGNLKDGVGQGTGTRTREYR